jgi:hypothetical protein
MHAFIDAFEEQASMKVKISLAMMGQRVEGGGRRNGVHTTRVEEMVEEGMVQRVEAGGRTEEGMVQMKRTVNRSPSPFASVCVCACTCGRVFARVQCMCVGVYVCVCEEWI